MALAIKNIAKNKILFWILAFLITVFSAIYQRMTGPTHPYKGEVKIEEQKLSFKLIRTETTGKDLPISIEVADTSISGHVQFKRYKSTDKWSFISLERNKDFLEAELPSQPPAGKILYLVFLEKNGNEISITGNEPVVARYKGKIPDIILLPHILLMFIAMLFSIRTVFEAFFDQGKAYQYMLWTIGFFLIGGLILGPQVQKYAFGELWTGIPFGYDLTDNKTLIAMVGWLIAWIKNRNEKEGRGWIIFAGILMLAIYLIPHSILGSELDYTKMK